MIFKVYQNYLGKTFLITFIKAVFIFIGLAFVLNIFEEINFFKDLEYLNIADIFNISKYTINYF